MTLPLVVLAFLSVFSGWLGVPHIIGGIFGHMPNFLEGWLSKSVLSPELSPANVALEWGLMAASLVGALLAALVARELMLKEKKIPEFLRSRTATVFSFWQNKYFFDHLYNNRIVAPIVEVSKSLWIHIDKSFIDRTTHLVAGIVQGSGGVFRQHQNGNFQQYASYILYGAVFIVLFLIFKAG